MANPSNIFKSSSELANSVYKQTRNRYSQFKIGILSCLVMIAGIIYDAYNQYLWIEFGCDADNYKKLNKIIVPGRYTDDQINEIISSLSERQWFIPSMIGFPEEKIDDKETDADHPWFELAASDFEPSNEKPDIDKSPEEIVALFKSMKGHWEEGALLC